MRRARVVIAVVVAGLALPGVGVAQSAGEIVDRMLSAYEQRGANVDNYTVVQDLLGFESVTYYEKERVDGRSVFRLVRSSTAGMELDEPNGGGVDEIFLMGDELAQRAEYLGRETVDDYEVHVLDLPDLSGTEFGRNVTPDSEFSATSGRLYIDVDTWVPRRMEFQGEMSRDGERTPIGLTIDLGDFRDSSGLLLPYHTVVTMEGIGQAIDEETRAQFEQMQQELENMPAEQRRVVESMMAGQLERFRTLMEDREAPMVIEILVREVRINQGPPS